MAQELIILEPLNMPLGKTADLHDRKVAIFYAKLPAFGPVLANWVSPRGLGATEVVAGATRVQAQISIREHRNMARRRVCGFKALPQVIRRCARGLNAQEVS